MGGCVDSAVPTYQATTLLLCGLWSFINLVVTVIETRDSFFRPWAIGFHKRKLHMYTATLGLEQDFQAMFYVMRELCSYLGNAVNIYAIFCGDGVCKVSISSDLT